MHYSLSKIYPSLSLTFNQRYSSHQMSINLHIMFIFPHVSATFFTACKNLSSNKKRAPKKKVSAVWAFEAFLPSCHSIQLYLTHLCLETQFKHISTHSILDLYLTFEDIFHFDQRTIHNTTARRTYLLTALHRTIFHQQTPHGLTTNIFISSCQFYTVANAVIL